MGRPAAAAARRRDRGLRARDRPEVTHGDDCGAGGDWGWGWGWEWGGRGAGQPRGRTPAYHRASPGDPQGRFTMRQKACPSDSRTTMRLEFFESPSHNNLAFLVKLPKRGSVIPNFIV